MAQNAANEIDGSGCLVVGNPCMPNKVIPQLSGAEEEARSVASILGCEPCCGQQATKEFVMSSLPKSQIIHLATHATLSDSLDDLLGTACRSEGSDYAVKGAVILSRSHEGCSGIITSKEIQSMKLNAELAVLSCCKTACGKVTEDGILGLSRALLTAGVCCVVVTLWSIYDSATSDIMRVFYRKYKDSRDAPFALQQALLAVKQGHPACWAAFCVIGVSPGAVKLHQCW